MTGNRALDLHERGQLVAGKLEVRRGSLEAEPKIPAGLFQARVGAKPFQLDTGAIGE